MKIFKNNAVKDSKLAVVTRARDDYDLARITNPVIQEYANRCRADFIIINEDKLNLGDFSFELFQCYDLFDTYDRILSIDSDALVTPLCPDLFETVPYKKIGVVYEDRFSRKKNRQKFIRMCQQKYDDIGWRRGYINTGAILFSECHKNILTYESGKIWNDLGYDDILIGYNIIKYGHEVHELSYKFNHMSMFSEIGKNWLKSYIIHYAGRGFSKKSRSEQIKADYEDLQHISNPFLLNFYRIPERLRLLAIGVYNYLYYK